MLVLRSEITIGDFVFDFVTDVEFSESVDELTSGGFIDIPRNVVFKKDNQVIQNIVEGADALFKRGDAVTIKLGYEPNLNTYFEGFISMIRPGFPLRFEIEDPMYSLKQTRVSPLNLKNTSLENLIGQLPIESPTALLDANLGNFRIARQTTVSKVLAYIKDNYGLSAYFRPDGTLSVGFAFDIENIETENIPLFSFGRNIIDDTNLMYQRSDDQFIKLTAVSIFPDNTKIEIDLGDEDGEQKTIFQYNVSESDLRKFAEEQLGKLKYEGFVGSFETFLEPQVRKGTAIRIENVAFPEKDGIYLVRSVRTKFGQDGGRQFIELERKLS